MDKSSVDRTITEFMEKIFGFAITKTRNTDQATELASRIIYDVYISLLKTEQVQNIDGYVFRISQNVYARFVDEKARGRYVNLDNMHVPAEGDFTLDVENDDTYLRLRQKVSYLGKIQREIVVMHYFERFKLSEIAKHLNLPYGTVKWHLHEARNQLKGGVKMSAITNLNLKPIQFKGMFSSGNPAPGGIGTEFYLSKLIAQNIAYAAYWKPRTITEIAETLCVPAAYIENEVANLEENSFLDRLPGGKYQTNMYIMYPNREMMERKHELFKNYANIVCEQYVPLVLDFITKYDNTQLYTPKNDLNFLTWTLVSYCCKHMFYFKPSQYDSKYRVKRKDGGDYISGAIIFDDSEDCLSFNREIYSAPNNMTRWGNMPVHAWQLTTCYDTRNNDYNDNNYTDYCWLYEFMTGIIAKEATNADKFKRLYDKGYLAVEGHEEYVNMVVSAMSEGVLQKTLPTPTEGLKQVGNELDRVMYELEKDQFPPHMQELCRLWCSNSLSAQDFVAYVLTQLVTDGIFKPLTDVQKASVNTIMFCDVLPQ